MTIPATRVPFMYVEFNSERAFQGSPLLNLKTLMIGQRLSSGTLAALTPLQVTSADQARKAAGAGSQLARMAESWFKGNKQTPLYIIGLADHGSGVAATGTITITGPATAAGVLSVYIGGRTITVSVANADTANGIAANLNTAINADSNMAVSSGVASNVVTLTAKNKGTNGNDIDVRVNYNVGDSFPAGVSAAIVAMASGATNPDITAALDAVGDAWFQLFVGPYYDTANLLAIENELDYRFGPMAQIDGYYITARPGTLSTLTTFGLTRNSKYTCIVNANKCLTTPSELASAVAAQVAKAASDDPARPFQTLELTGVLPPLDSEQFLPTENNSLLSSGIATIQVQSGKVQIQRLITTYQTNPAGAADIAYLDLNTLLTLQYLRWSFRNRILSKYPRAKLADDSARIASGQSIMTPAIGRAEAISWARDMESKGLVENIEQFKKDLVVVRSASDPNRMEWTLPPDLVNQFMVGGAVVQFLLQSP